MAIITNSGRAAIAQSVKNEVLFLAWGTGDEEWNNDRQPEDITQPELLREVGRRIADSVVYCIGDDEGELITPSGRFTVSEEPTNNLCFTVNFDFEDGVPYTIRELGLFTGTEVDPECPEGQRYFLPTEIIDPGILLVLENTVPLIRTDATRESLCFVVTF